MSKKINEDGVNKKISRFNGLRVVVDGAEW